MRVCASLSSASELDTPTRLVEIRLDLLGSVPEDPKGHEMLVTFRGPVDTGILPEGFSGMIDIGEGHRPETSATVVASHHDFEGTPTAERIRSILSGMDCDIAKGAFSVGSFRDLVSILDAARSLGKRHVVLGMGQLGTITRVRADILGNEFSFGYVGEPTAPGQLSAERMERLPDGCTVLGIVGKPLSKSRSPAMQNAALEAAGIDGIYLPFEADDLDQVEEVVRGYGIRGLNVTIPYKIDIMDHLDAVTADASAVGAVNTVVNEEGRLVGLLAAMDDGEMIAYIHYSLVALEAQGRGVGSRLLQAALARYRGCTRVVLHTDGAGVQAFYRKHGFSPPDSVCMGLTPKSE